MATAELLMTQAEIDADPDKWLARKREGFGGSEAAMLLDLAPDRIGGRFTLYHRKLAGIVTTDTPAMERGRWLEPYVAERYAEARPDLTVLPGGLYRSARHPWMLDTPDRLAAPTLPLAGGVNGGRAFPVQLKTSIPEDEFDSSGEFTYLPAYHRAQALWDMETQGADVVDVPVLFIRPWEVTIFTLTRDAAAQRDIDLLCEAAEEMTWRLEHRVEPDVDSTAACTDTLRKLYPGIEDRAVRVPIRLARRYRRWLAHRRMAEANLNLARNEILARMGTAGLAVARDTGLGKARDDYLVKIASRTAGPRQEYTVEAAERIERMNPSGWSRG